MRSERKSVSNEKAKQKENERASEAILTSADETWKEYPGFEYSPPDYYASSPDASASFSGSESTSFTRSGAGTAASFTEYGPGFTGPGTSASFTGSGPGTSASFTGSGPGTSASFTGSGPGTSASFTGYGPGTSASFTGSGPGTSSLLAGSPGPFDHFYHSTYHQTPMVIYTILCQNLYVLMKRL